MTKLEPQKRARGRTNVYVDGRFAFGLADEAIAEAGLRPGDRLTAELVRDLLSGDEYQRARERALRLLTGRERTGKELRMRLLRVGFAETVVERVVERLTDIGYVNDRRYAELFCREKRRAGWGARRVRDELLGKGVDRTTVESVLADSAGADDDMESALVETLARKFSAEMVRDPQRARRRALGYLVRRGHDYEFARRVVGRAFEEE